MGEHVTIMGALVMDAVVQPHHRLILAGQDWPLGRVVLQPLTGPQVVSATFDGHQASCQGIALVDVPLSLMGQLIRCQGT